MENNEKFLEFMMRIIGTSLTCADFKTKFERSALSILNKKIDYSFGQMNEETFRKFFIFNMVNNSEGIVLIDTFNTIYNYCKSHNKLQDFKKFDNGNTYHIVKFIRDLHTHGKIKQSHYSGDEWNKNYEKYGVKISRGENIAPSCKPKFTFNDHHYLRFFYDLKKFVESMNMKPSIRD